MSIHVMDLVWRRMSCGGGELLLALAIADYANDAGKSIFPSVDTLCAKTRQGRRTVQRQLAMFRELGWLQVESNLRGGRRMTTRYAINPEWIKGANLARFPDRISANDDSETAPSTTGNRAIAMAHDPSGSVIDPRTPPKPPSAARKGARSNGTNGTSKRAARDAARQAAEKAWASVQDVRYERRRGPLTEIDSLAALVLSDLGGMYRLNNIETREVPAFKKRFRDEYVARLSTSPPH